MLFSLGLVALVHLCYFLCADVVIVNELQKMSLKMDEQAAEQAAGLQAVKEEVRSTKAPKKVTLSSMTATTATRIVEASNLSRVEMDEPAASLVADCNVPADADCSIDWNDYHDEPAATPAVRDKLERLLRAGGVLIGRGGYKVVDVHNDMLFNSLPFGAAGDLVLSGKTDIIVVPYKSSAGGYGRQLRLVYDLKTTEAFATSAPIQVGQQLAASRISQHPVMTVFSDQSTGARVTVIKGKAFEETPKPVSLQCAGYMMCEFLKSASSDATYTLEAISEEDRGAAASLIVGAHMVKDAAPPVSDMLLRELELADDIVDPIVRASERYRALHSHMPWEFATPIPDKVSSMYG